MKKWPERLIAMLINLRDQGLSLSLIAEQINKEFPYIEPKLTRSGVAGKIFRLNLPPAVPAKKMRKMSAAKGVSKPFAKRRLTPPACSAANVTAGNVCPRLSPGKTAGIPILELGPQNCRWPIDLSQPEEPRRYCGKPVLGMEEDRRAGGRTSFRRVYCEQHYRMAVK